MKKTVLIYSGGLDSTVLLYDLAVRQSRAVFALSIDYGQRHRHELAHAAHIVELLNNEALPAKPVQHHVLDLSNMRPLLKGSSQTDNGVSVPHGHYAEESMKLTVVPNRNMVMLSLATAWAISEKADDVAYAAHAGDHAIYPDCRPAFRDAMNSAMHKADWHLVNLNTPYIGMTKADIVRHGAKLGVPFKITYSCYEGEAFKHCGKCGTCTERIEAFALAGVIDPTEYALKAA